MNINKILFGFIVGVIFCGGCSVPLSVMPSNDVRNDKSKRNIGYEVTSPFENFYYLKYTCATFSALDPYTNAWIMHDKKVSELCGEGKNILTDKTEVKHTDSFPGWLMTVSSSVDCTGSAKLNHQQKILNEKEQLKIQMNGVKSDACDVPKDENITSYGKKLFENSFYGNAMTCFRKASKENESGHISNFYIGLMYEMGYGVEKDLEEAKKWYANYTPVN